MLDKIIERTFQYIDSMPKKLRKTYGQFFTSKETARYMASLFEIPKQKTITLLDAGAGSGILSCAMIERLESVAEIDEIEITCYETDENVLPLLQENLRYSQSFSKKKITMIRASKGIDSFRLLDN